MHFHVASAVTQLNWHCLMKWNCTQEVVHMSGLKTAQLKGPRVRLFGRRLCAAAGLQNCTGCEVCITLLLHTGTASAHELCIDSCLLLLLLRHIKNCKSTGQDKIILLTVKAGMPTCQQLLTGSPVPTLNAFACPVVKLFSTQLGLCGTVYMVQCTIACHKFQHNS